MCVRPGPPLRWPQVEVSRRTDPGAAASGGGGRGPVCILAGAGWARRRRSRGGSPGRSRPARSGRQILAVTFTDKAAGEMKARLARSASAGVEARRSTRPRSRSSTATRRNDRPDPAHEGAAPPTDRERLPPPYKFRPAGDLATEVERAKARRVRPTLPPTLGDHEPPIPANLMHGLPRVRAAQGPAAGEIDFEDVLELAVGSSRRTRARATSATATARSRSTSTRT